jgi:hypothetical protein
VALAERRDEDPAAVAAGFAGGGDGAHLAVRLPAGAWVRQRVSEGEKGPREYEFARLWVIERQHGEPGPEGWMVCRPVGCRDPEEFTYPLSNAPARASLERMAWVAGARWTIEEDFEPAKGEVGLDH